MENSVANQLTTEKSSKTFSATNRRQFDSRLVWQSTRLDTHSFTHSHTHSFTHSLIRLARFSASLVTAQFTINAHCYCCFPFWLLLVPVLVLLLCSRLSAIKLALCFPDSLASSSIGSQSICCDFCALTEIEHYNRHLKWALYR